MALLLVRTAELWDGVCQPCQAADKTSVDVERCREEMSWQCGHAGVAVTDGFLAVVTRRCHSVAITCVLENIPPSLRVRWLLQ